jgi:quercetin dioxygenase-like cupin family protein
MSEAKMKIMHYSQAPAVPIGESAPGSTMRWLIDKKNDGAPLYSLRLVEMQPGGNSLRHSHAYEHENFVLEGKGRVLIGETWFDVRAGDVIFIPGNILHTFENNSDGLFSMLCAAPL